MKLQGIGVSPGLASGKAVVLESRATTIFRLPIPSDQVEQELERLTEARETARRQITELLERASRLVGETFGRVFEAHLLILDDAQLQGRAEEIIRTERVNVEWALKTVAEDLLQAFDRIDDPYFRERGGDLEDVHNRLQIILAGERHHHELSELAEDSVVVAHSLSPSDVALLDHDRVVAFCTDLGGRTSHTAILAQALQIPAVVGLQSVLQAVRGGDLLVVDGGLGEVTVRPSEEDLTSYQRARVELARHELALHAQRDLPAVTLDGEVIHLMANIEFPEEIAAALSHGALGVGLYRSEFLFVSCSPRLPTEEDHWRVYEEIARRMAPQDAVIRTLDLGGDKYFHEVLAKDEANPVMGLRAIRFCLRRPDIFKTQLRGLLRASSNRNLKVMFPLVSGVGELRQALGVLEEVRREMRRDGIPFNEGMEIGIMIEVPSAALTADLLASEVDFFSIGTNDLLQYCLALDRGNQSLAYLYQPFHPGLLRLLESVVRSGRRKGVEVSLCGEMASDPLALPVLVGMGLRRLSMNAAAIPEIKSAVRRIEAARAASVLRELLEMATAEEIEERVRREFPPPLPESAFLPNDESPGKPGQEAAKAGEPPEPSSAGTAVETQ